MKKFNSRKILLTISLLSGLGLVAIAFQNFTPHDPFQNQDAKDLFLNGALTQALENAEKEHKQNRETSNVDPDQIEEAVKKKPKKVSTISIDGGFGVDDQNSAREPASVGGLSNPLKNRE